MAFKDLREFIRTLGEQGELVEVNVPVDPVLEFDAFSVAQGEDIGTKPSPDYSRNPWRDSGDARSCKACDARRAPCGGPTKAYSMQYFEEGERAQRSKYGQIRCRSRIS